MREVSPKCMANVCYETLCVGEGEYSLSGLQCMNGMETTVKKTRKLECGLSRVCSVFLRFYFGGKKEELDLFKE